MSRRSKRVNGDGSVYRRGSGYEAAITAQGGRRTARAKSRVEAEAALRRLRAERDTGRLPRRGDTGTGEFLEHWVEQRRPELRYSTYRCYRELAVGKAVPVIGGVPLGRLTALHLQNLYARCLAEGLSKRTVLHLHRVLHKAFADAEAWDLVDSNVARKATPPRIQQTPPQVLTAAEVRRLLNDAREHPFGPLIVLAVTTGARQGELLGLRWRDVDLEECTASIHQTVQRAESGRVVGLPKTAQSRRDVELVSVARDCLLAQRRRQAALRLASERWEDSDLVFTDSTGQPLNPARVSRNFKALLCAAGLDRMQFKNLRHTFATMHLDTGVSDLVVSQVLGHTRPSTTNRYYRRVDRSHQRAAAARLEALLSGPEQDAVAGGVAGTDPTAGGSKA